jgi:tRNA (cmo5U34)-methyltransferase
MTERDTLFAGPVAEIAGFRFDEDVVAVFPDMIKRSVPGYQTIIAMTGTLAERYAQANSNCYDLGCSLGASTLAMRRAINVTNCRIVAVDNSPEMIKRCKAILSAESSNVPVDLIRADILDSTIVDASMVVMNFTLQFIAPTLREKLIQEIYRGLKPGGIFILSEKIAFADQHLNELMVDLHHSFKRANHYSDLEISQKRTALDNVLLPETLTKHRARLHDAGFNKVEPWFQCFNFASLLAIK